MRGAQESFEADAVEAPVEVAIAARSRRRRSDGLLGAVAVVACVAVGAAGVGIASPGAQPEPSFSASPSAVPSEDLSVPLASATIPIVGGSEYENLVSSFECGAPAPAPTGTVDHFGVNIADAPPLKIGTYEETGGGRTNVDTWITYDAAESLPVAQTPVILVLVHDGLIAGTFAPDPQTSKYWTYSDFESFYGGSTMMPFGPFCPSVSTSVADDGGWAVLNPGEYQVVPVARLWANQEVAALRYLYSKGFTVGEFPASQRPAAFLPGSWDCTHTVDPSWVPRACLGDVTANAIVNQADGTVTLPYDPEQFTEILDVTVVGEPVALSVPAAFEVPTADGYVSKPLDVSDPIECGTTFDYTTSDAGIQVSGEVPGRLGIGAGAFNSFNVGVLPNEQGAGEMDLEYGAKAWLVAGVAEDYNYFQARPGNQKVVGVADVSIAGGNTVPYDRFVGPTVVDLVLNNVQLCDDFSESDVLESVIVDGNIALTPTGAPPANHEHTLLFVQNFGWN